jgi:hypothetical protein
VQPFHGVGDQSKRGRALALRLLLAGGKPVAIGLRFGVRAPALRLDQRNGRLDAGGEILVEQIFGGCLHSFLSLCMIFSENRVPLFEIMR